MLRPYAQTHHQGEGRPGSRDGGRGRGQVTKACEGTLACAGRVVEQAGVERKQLSQGADDLSVFRLPKIDGWPKYGKGAVSLQRPGEFVQLAHQTDAQSEELGHGHATYSGYAGSLVPSAEKLHSQVQGGCHAPKHAGHGWVVSGRDPVGREHPIAQGHQGAV